MLQRVVYSSAGLNFSRSFNTVARPSFKNNVKHIKSLTHTERKRFFDSFDQVFCDCDGVVWHTTREAIPGSSQAIDYLRKSGKPVTFVTNFSICSTADHMEKFQKSNIPVEKQDVVHPAQTICEHLRAIRFDGLIYCIASTPFKDLLREAGFRVVQEHDRIIEESMSELYSVVHSEEPVKAVIIDADFNLTAAKLMRAHMHLKDPECLFIGGSSDSIIPFEGVDVIGPGPFVNVVEQTSRREATILGKPGRQLCEWLKNKANLRNPSRALFVGDSLNSDVRFGNMSGFQTLLVLSGGTKAQDLDGELSVDETPDYVADGLADFVGFLKG